MQAVLVVAQDLDDLAVRDCALGALRQHAFQFLLQGLTARNTVLDRDKLAAMTTTIPFSGLENAAHDILDGKVRGRLVVEIG